VRRAAVKARTIDLSKQRKALALTMGSALLLLSLLLLIRP
jgi:hypothetical protein